MLQLSCWQSLNHSLPFGFKSAMTTTHAGQTGARCSLESIQEHAAAHRYLKLAGFRAPWCASFLSRLILTKAYGCCLCSLDDVLYDASSDGGEPASVPDSKDEQVSPCCIEGSQSVSGFSVATPTARLTWVSQFSSDGLYTGRLSYPVRYVRCLQEARCKCLLLSPVLWRPLDPLRSLRTPAVLLSPQTRPCSPRLAEDTG